ncbi:hypothetical protein LUZ60_013376 [Juncus effusus]|nr:hypothetical protein LUZ60_013376 [Juncus effusus]
MERIPAAFAMEWSIEFDKGLRSKHQDECNSALEKIGPRLQQLSKEPNITKSIAETYNLVLSEDKLFINTIILRLCNSFKNGDNSTRSRILKVFLTEFEQIKKKGRGYNGIFAKERVCNSEEILRKVKSVFYKGCSEAKVLALRVFGCLAGFVKDSTEIRLLVLSSLKASDPLVIKGALFTASSFCLLSEDFSRIFLELLANFIASSNGHADVMLTAVRSFSKIRCTFSVSSKSYRVGRMLVVGLSEERLKAEMLSSLTILASRYTILSSQQVDLLIQFLTPEASNLMKFKALECLFYLFNHQKSHFAIKRDVFSALLLLIEDSNIPLRFQCLALRILHKILSTFLPNIFIETINLSKIIQTLKNGSHSSQKNNRLLTIQIHVEIVHICFQFQIIPENSEPVSENEKENKIADYVTDIIMDNIVSLTEKLSDSSKEFGFSEFKALLGFFLQIAKDYPLVVLERIEFLIEILKNENENLGLFIVKFLNAYLSIIYENEGVKMEDIYHTVKPSLDYIKQNSYESFCLSMNLYSNDQGPKFRSDREIRAIKLSKNIIEKRNYWEAYKIGIYSCCEGLWFNSSFIFKILVGVMNSNVYNSWFKSLLLLCGNESEIKLILFPRLGLKLVHELNKELDCSKDEKDMDLDHEKVDLRDFEEKFGTICSRLFSCEENLESNNIFYFQRWFINLRARFLEIILDLIKTINKTGNETLIRDGNLKLVFSNLSNCSSRLIELGKEYDLICASFFHMDKKSHEIISSFALICSSLAFCIVFLLDFKISIIPFLEDLFERLQGIDGETTTQLMQLVQINPLAKDLMKSRVEKGYFGYLNRDCGSLCKFAISGLSQMRKCVDKESRNEGDFFPFMNKELEFLSEILRNCMEVNFRVPKYFFKIRPCIGAELFIFDSNPQNKPEISISKGSHLSLNLCIQLKNIPQNTLSHITKLHCILSTRPSHISHSSRSGFSPQNTKEMVELSSVLWQYIKDNSVNLDKSEGNLARAFLEFEVNERGLGFGCCLLDVSKFEEGLYQIKWLDCFVDEKGAFCSLVPLNAGVVFSIKNP